MMMTIFLCVYFPFVYPLQWNLCSSLLSVFQLGFFNVEFQRSLCILDNNPLSDVWYTTIFFLACHFSLWTRSFTEQKHLLWQGQIYQYFLLWIVFLFSCLRALQALFPKIFSKNFSKVLSCYVSHLNLWPILSSPLCKSYEVFQMRFFCFFLYGCLLAPAPFLHQCAFVPLPQISWAYLCRSVICQYHTVLIALVTRYDLIPGRVILPTLFFNIFHLF